MPWTVEVSDEAIGDAEWFGRKLGRALLQSAIERLGNNPLAETKHMKTLRPNPIAERELRVRGDYRVLFDVDPHARIVQVLVIGEKQGNQLFVRGQEYTRHHETDPTE